jgi:ligand-binding sensor domain-containing protein
MNRYYPFDINYYLQKNKDIPSTDYNNIRRNLQSFAFAEYLAWSKDKNVNLTTFTNKNDQINFPFNRLQFIYKIKILSETELPTNVNNIFTIWTPYSTYNRTFYPMYRRGFKIHGDDLEFVERLNEAIKNKSLWLTTVLNLISRYYNEGVLKNIEDDSNTEPINYLEEMVKHNFYIEGDSDIENEDLENAD